MATMLVKMHKPNKKMGHVLKRYAVGGMIFEADGRWRKVPVELAERLRTVHSRPDRNSGPLAFLVMTEEEARRHEQAESRKQKLGTAAGEVVLPEDLVVAREETLALRAENKELRRSMAEMMERLERLEGRDGPVELEAVELAVDEAEPGRPVVDDDDDGELQEAEPFEDLALVDDPDDAESAKPNKAPVEKKKPRKNRKKAKK